MRRITLFLKQLGPAFMVGIPYFWLVTFFLIPFLLVLKISFAEMFVGIPPFRPLMEWVSEDVVNIRLSFESYRFILEDDLYIWSYVSSLGLASAATALCLLIAFPFAYCVTCAPRRWRSVLLLFAILPFWTSFLVRVYAWMGILTKSGLLNTFLLWLGLIDHPLEILHTNMAVVIGIVYCYLPFMVLPIYVALERQDPFLIEAAYDLGCRPWKAFWKVTVPLAMPGVKAGTLLVFIPALGEYVIPELMGGSETLMIGRVLWDEMFLNRDWPVATAIACSILIIIVIPVTAFQRMISKEERG